ncbi:septum site-determining protein MinC [Blochmannia endosymbiont of Camponotus (Colobopsis) obliquus]|uniref:septum site-determining protein MinC n=1 Tax=Blochmannia endosymbiont of Camponotus (Colobopsis) obliquus TaxID=1505597 RepID=UPI00061A7330|nr:septum site-determining protein MinC [Blochmannia endosymbiont of Camponotus (Colobopsis) obliquus]AKC60594.1 septum site-determining protein MinC [Blochmannia endosymbiont of Camponotus (Colobopsis) obliquus]
MSIKFKFGNFNLSIIYIHDISSEEIYKKIQKKIKQSPNFFNNVPIVISVKTIVHPNHWTQIYKAILDTGLCIIGVCHCRNNILRNIILKSGVPILNEEIIKTKYSKHAIPNIQKNNIKKTKIINIPIRSGQQIYARNSDLIITHNINNGAEIISDGNIHIYGTMNGGRVIAGASGDETCQIFCTHFLPEVISISGKYLLHEQLPTKFLNKSVKIRLQDKILIIQNLF